MPIPHWKLEPRIAMPAAKEVDENAITLPCKWVCRQGSWNWNLCHYGSLKAMKGKGQNDKNATFAVGCCERYFM